MPSVRGLAALVAIIQLGRVDASFLANRGIALEPTEPSQLPAALASHHKKSEASLQLKSSTTANIQKLLEASPDGIASLVVMGDSTIAGLAGEFLDLPDGWWEVHLANDRPAKYHGTEGPVFPGEQWSANTKGDDRRFVVAREAVKRAAAATEALHTQNCTWTGGLETFTLGPPLRGFILHRWGFLPEYGATCWHKCFADAMRAIKPSAIMWNIGLHLLNHRFDKMTCDRRSNPSKPNCGDYQDMVRRGMYNMADATPTLVWRTTNYVCEPKLVQRNPKLERDLVEWRDGANRPALEEQCHQDCPKFSDKECYNWLMNGRATELQYNQSLKAIDEGRTLSRGRSLRVLDAFKLTRDCCETGECDATDDGEHYQGLDAQLANDLTSIMVENL